MVHGSQDASEAFIRYFSTQVLGTGNKIQECFHLRLHSLMEENRFSVLCHCCHPEPVWMAVFWKSDSSSRISARISCSSIARFYLLHLQCHPFRPLTNWLLEHITEWKQLWECWHFECSAVVWEISIFWWNKVSGFTLLSHFVKHLSSFIYMAVNIPFSLLRNTEANNTELRLEMETQESISLYLYTQSHNVRARGSKKKNTHASYLWLPGEVSYFWIWCPKYACLVF